MIQNGEKTSEAEQLRQVDQQAVSRHLGVRNRQIVHTEEPEQWLSVPPSPPLWAACQWGKFHHGLGRLLNQPNQPDN